MATKSHRIGSGTRYEPAERKRLVDEFKRSAMSIAEFARARSIQYSTFCAWLRRAEVSEASAAPEFFEVELSPEDAQDCLSVEIGLQARLQIGSAEQAEWAGCLIAAYDREVSC